MPTSPILALSSPINPCDADSLLDALSIFSFTPTVSEDLEKRTCVLEVFLEDAETAPTVRAQIEQTAASLNLPLTLSQRTLAPEDWSESWKRFFHTERVSERLVVRPIWESYAPAPHDVVIDIDPGMSFGTGRHGTTKACLLFLDKLARANPNRTVLDMGSGSGILAIAAAKLGFKNVEGFDNDPDAVAIAQRNATMNGLPPIPFHTADLATWTRPADIVVANILAVVLIEFAPAISDCAPQTLIISGVLDEQYPSVLAAFEAQGFVERENVLLDIWRTGHLER